LKVQVAFAQLGSPANKDFNLDWKESQYL